MAFPDLTSAGDLMAALRAAPWGDFDPARDAARLADRLIDAPPEARKLALDRLSRHARLGVPHLQVLGITGLGASRDGRLLAVGGECEDDAHMRATLSVWDLRTLRILHTLTDIAGPVGWGDQSGCVQWLPDDTLVLAFSTNVVGTFDPLGGGEPAASWDLTSGQDTPPPFACGDRAVFVSVWGEHDQCGAIVRPGAEPRWIGAGVGSLGRPAWLGGEISGQTRDDRVFLDATSGRVVARAPGAPQAWSPDRRRVVVGDSVRDARTDALLFRFPGARECGFLDADLAYAVHRDHVALASAAGVTRIDVEVARPSGGCGDVRTVAASPDGRRLAILAADGHVYVADRTGRVLHGTTVGPITGLLWASPDRLVGASSHHLAFFDGNGAGLAEHSVLLGPGNAPPPRERVPGDATTTVVRATAKGPAFYGIGERVVHARPDAMPALMPTLAWRVGRTAWPAEWAPPELKTELLPNLRTGQPFRIWLPPPTDTGLTAERIRKAMPQGIPAPSWEIGWYRAPAVLSGATLTDAHLQELVGKPILWAERWRPAYLRMGVLLGRLEGVWMTASVHRPSGGTGSGPLELERVAWLGEAKPLGA